MFDQLQVFFGSASFLEIFAALGTALTIFLGGIKIGRLVSSRSVRLRLQESSNKLRAANEQVSNLDQRFGQIQQVLDGEVNFWLRPTKHNMTDHVGKITSSKPIITICNFKGGVGKTTLAANLAAYFDNHLGKRVLLIDFDYQGSLTDTLLASAQLPQLEASAIRLIEGIEEPEKVYFRAVPLHPALSRTKLFPCFYGFNRVENRLLLQWITQKEDREIRFNTHKYLSSSVFQENFDVIIIDAPPRLMTGTMNAACASTHLLIPTVLDGLSITAALNTLGVFHELRKDLTHTLQVLGIVPTLVSEARRLNSREDIALRDLQNSMPEYWRTAPMPPIFSETWVCRREAIAKVAGQGLAFNADPEIRDMFISLGDKISERIFVDEGARLASSATDPSANVTRLNVARRG